MKKESLREWVHAFVWLFRHGRGQLGVPELPYLVGYLKPDDVAVDVGAHAGSWCLPLARALPRGRVHAFEALPYYARTLAKLLLLTRTTQVQLRNVAVSAHPGSVHLVWKDAAGHRLTGLTHVASDREPVEGTIEVQASPLDELLRDETGRVVLIKCDVEGVELDVFRGGMETLKRHRPIVFTEVAPGNSARYGNRSEDLFDLFASQGYRPYVFTTATLLEACVDFARTGKNDVLFLPPGANPR